ncbi:probable G-protein coupled receptor 22 [Cynoglossus semilaevis]|uniref:probable G-protein coupled receptor 22 n=1 Tax=Cynoglossus semilaevis TaxID=244447 RepID=UPI000D62F684|nr:probable G-protein coupled receptor 22 [Cynoglossus semilaevis]
MTVASPADPCKLDMRLSEDFYPISFQVPMTGILLVEIVLGLSSNLTVLIFYCMKQNLMSSISNFITVNLHVVDLLVCVCCIPMTAVVVLPPIQSHTAMIWCFHEACVSFGSVATASTVLAITVDRYDISVRPAHRVLKNGRSVVFLGAIWASSSFSFMIPFMEVGFVFNTSSNQTAVVTGIKKYYTEEVLYYHLLIQIHIFIFTAIVMLVTYYKILQALKISIGNFGQQNLFKKRQKGKNTKALRTPTRKQTTGDSVRDTRIRVDGSAPVGIRESVSAIIALRRAVRNHRERRKKRTLKMSILIISSFMLCWTPITALNIIILRGGLSDFNAQLRLSFLAMAYGTTIIHPLLYTFTLPKFQKILKSRIRKKMLPVVNAK